MSVKCEKLMRHKKRQHGNRVVPQRQHRLKGFEILERRIVLSNSVPLAPAITEPLLDGHVVNSSYEKDGVAVASLLWSIPSTPKQVIPQSNLLSLTDQINHPLQPFSFPDW